MNKFTTSLSLSVILFLGACAGPGGSTPPTQATIAPVGPLTYAINDTAYDVARDVAKQFPQLSEFHHPQATTNATGMTRKTVVTAVPDGYIVHLYYQNHRIVTEGGYSEAVTTTSCDLRVFPVAGAPGQFTITTSPLTEKIGYQQLFPLNPVAPIDKIAADIGSALSKLRQSDVARETSEIRQLAMAGNDEAQFRLGFAYESGEGAPRDYAESAKWYRKSADQGNKLAQYQLAFTYEQGRGIAQDFTEAVKWYRRSAEQGVPDAQINLGNLYARGNGVLQDYAQAYKWWMLAKAGSNRGDETYSVANRNMEIYANRMAPSQIAHAQQEASAWSAAHSAGR